MTLFKGQISNHFLMLQVEQEERETVNYLENVL